MPDYKIGEMIAQRNAFGDSLIELADEYSNMVVFDADVGESTQTAAFGKKYPNRFYQMGIAEANMVTAAGAMSTLGLVPFVSTFAVFLTKRAGEQIRNSIAHPSMNVKLNGSYAGLPTGRGGATHSAIEDLAVMRVMPNVKIFDPADARETFLAIKLALDTEGPVYVRTVRCPVPVIFDNMHKTEWGTSSVLKEGSDIVVISSGMTSHKALDAARELEKENISVKVIHMGSIKPIDTNAIIEAAEKFKTIITVENHSIIGGLGSAVCEVTSEHCPCKVVRLGFKDIFLESGDDEELFDVYKMNTSNIKKILLNSLK